MSKAHVRLRPHTEADLPHYVEWLNDPEVTQFTQVESGAVTLDGEREWLARVSAPDSTTRNWAIEVNGRHIGNCALHLDGGGLTAGFGIIIGDKTEWGKGYGSAALRQVLRIGFEEMGLHRIHLIALAANTRGIKCDEKCGFRHEGVRRRHHLKREKWCDVVCMGILRDEWEARELGLTPDVEWQNCIDALSPQPGEVIVDAGCGYGLRALSIASRVAPSGRVIGIEVNEERAEKAIERIAARGMQAIASIQRGDIRWLPLPDDSVDAWFCRETLEYLEDPTLALSEAIRVVRPEGRVVAMEADWDTLAYNATDKAAERRFVAVHTDCGGGGSVDGRTGRKLLSLFREAGLSDVRLEVHANWSDSYSPEDCYVCWPLREGHVGRGCITQEELDAWYADMSAQAQRGCYFHCFSHFICVGRVT
ncbi:MAG: GNAT family N-acetyltransferase [Armatimonadota bacterium]|nr:MAG: GNAT family N-acetyltransferase [Armatimonadota bacterium]